jgi:hypothetical protein
MRDANVSFFLENSFINIILEKIFGKIVLLTILCINEREREMRDAREK